MMGRWHGSFGTAGADALRQELRVAEGAIVRLDEEIAERRKLRREQRRQVTKITRRLRRLDDTTAKEGPTS